MPESEKRFGLEQGHFSIGATVITSCYWCPTLDHIKIWGTTTTTASSSGKRIYIIRSCYFLFHLNSFLVWYRSGGSTKLRLNPGNRGRICQAAYYKRYSDACQCKCASTKGAAHSKPDI
jgi:hypothetical protein